jgi:hypothetical protein
MILSLLSSRKCSLGLVVLFFPLLTSCSALGGGSASSDPTVNAQRQQVDLLENEVREQRRRTDEAELLYKREKDLLNAKKSELKASERLLKVYRDQAKR